MPVKTQARRDAPTDARAQRSPIVVVAILAQAHNTKCCEKVTVPTGLR